MSLRWWRRSLWCRRIRGGCRRRRLAGYGDEGAVVCVVRLGNVAVRVDDDQQRLAASDGDAGADIDAAAGFQREAWNGGAADELAAVGGEHGNDEITVCGAGSLIDDRYE